MIKNKFKKLVSVMLTLSQMITVFHCSAANLEAIVGEAAIAPPSAAISETNPSLEKELPDMPSDKDAESKIDGTAIIVQHKATSKDRDSTIIAQGICGATANDNVNWVLYSDGLLDISGTGAMKNYHSSSAPWNSHKSSIASVTIGSGVTSIGNRAFYRCSKLASINIPSSVTSIGGSAFYWCSSLKSIEIPDSVTSIGNRAFYWCSSLKSIEIPDSVTSIGNRAFYWCSSLKSIEIPDSVTSIGNRAFYRCSKLASINIPNSVASIGYGAFSGCTLLNFNEYNNAKYLGNTENRYHALMKSTSTEITSCQINTNTRVIAGNAFRNCSSLKSIEIPNSVTSIGCSAFEGCSKLESINIPDSVTSIESGAFRNCNSLKSIEIPNSVTSIRYYTLSDCSLLTSIEIPGSVTSIDDYAFEGCSSLLIVRYFGKSDPGKKSTRVFEGCNKLTGVLVDRNYKDKKFCGMKVMK